MKYLLLYVFCLTFRLAAQEQPMHFTNYTIKNGLPTSFITQIFQDHTGYIWIGNNNGLSRFDGSEFHNYFFDPNDSASLSGNRIYKIMEDRNHRLWIATDQGLSVYIPGTDRFHRFVPSLQDPGSLPGEEVFDIFEDSKGRIWVATYDGFCQYNPVRNNFIRFINEESTYGFDLSNRISSIAEDQEGQLWLAPQCEGLYLFNPVNGTFEHHSLEGKAYKKNINPNSKSLYIDQENIFWLGTRGNGFFRVDPKRGAWRWFYAQAGEENLNNNIIYEMNELTPGEMWIGTDGGGVNILNKKTGKFRHLMSNLLINNGLKSNATEVFLKDNQNNIWIGTVTNGLFVFSPYMNVFEQYRWSPDHPINLLSNVVLDVCEDDQGMLWVGTDGGGLYSLDRKTNKIRSFRSDPNNLNSLSTNVICDLFLDSRKNLWVGTFAGGLNLVNRTNGMVKRFLHQDNDTNSISNENVWDILEDHKGNLWIATLGGGLDRYDYKTGHFEHYRNQKNDLYSIPSDIINSIAEDKDGHLWLATNKGLAFFDPKTRKSVVVKLKQGKKGYVYDDIHCVFNDSKGNIWAGASAGAIFRVNPVTKKVDYFDISNKDLSNVVLGITEDRKGMLWVSGSVFFIALNPKTGAAVYYDEKDGLPTRQMTQTSSCLLRTGEIAFGTNDGLVIFNPEENKTFPYSPKILLSELKVSTHIVKTGELFNGRVILERPFYETEKLTLTRDEKEFTVKFSILQYVNQRKIKVLYKLEGFNDDWREADLNSRSISYTYLPPNTYRLILKADNGYGVWGKPTILTLEVLPSFWQQWWFRILVIVLIVGIFGIIIYMRTRHLENRKHQLEHIISERTGELAEANDQLEKKQQEVVSRNLELNALNHILKDQKEEIQQQNEKLSNYNLSLEKVVDERTMELQLALQKALESEKLKSSFLANMSHEIRTPMNSIIGFSNLLPNVTADPEKMKKYIDIIQSSSQSLMLLIDDIIDFSKIEAGVLEFHPADFELSDLLHELILNYQRENTNSYVEVLCECRCKQGEMIFSDKYRTKQILSNFLSNALKYTEYGRVILGCKPLENGDLEIYVKDTGIGIPRDKVDFIFEPFNKLEDNIEKLYRGAGLGLAISKYLAETMYYRIGLESEPGKGSKFFIIMPHSLRKGIGEEQSLMVRGESTVNFKDKIILVAEDEVNNYQFLEELLGTWGIKCIWARNGQECMDKIIQNSGEELVLMDIKMPVMDGVEATRLLKEKGYQKPVIALTAYASPADRNRYQAVNFEGYLVKPVNAVLLLEVLKKWMTS